jgi:hypothetical protein
MSAGEIASSLAHGRQFFRIREQLAQGLGQGRSSATLSAAPAAIASVVACRKLKVCGPTTTGQPQAAASIRF